MFSIVSRWQTQVCLNPLPRQNMARQVVIDALHDHNEDVMILIIKRDGSDSSQNRSPLSLATSLAPPMSRTLWGNRK
jgi:hypothetical protein